VETSVKTIKTILYSVTVAASGTLFPYDVAKADEPAQWECQPSKDFRSWVCLKDGQPPAEPAPEPIAESPTPVTRDEGVTVTPLAAPEKIQPEPIPPTAPGQVDKAEKKSETETPQIVTEETMPASIEPDEPVSAKLLAPAEPPPEPLPEPEAPRVIKPRDKVVTEAPVPAVSEEPVDTVEITEEPGPVPVTGQAAPEKPVVEEMPAPVTEEAQISEPAVISEGTVAEEPAPEAFPATAEPEPVPTAEEIVAKEPAPVAEEHKIEEPQADTVQPAAETAAREWPSSELVRIDNSLPSCVVITQPGTLTPEERKRLRETSATEIEANEATLEKNKLTILSGDVQIKRADQSLKADQVTLNKETNQADATGSVVYTDSEIELQSSQAHMDMDKDENTFNNASFTTLDHYARGSANQVQTSQGTQVRLDKVNYTSCPPGNNSWLLSADEIVLDDETGRGTAKNAKLEFFDVPVFYAPYMNFPIDDRRQSGLLTPRIGRSDDRGTEIAAPIYWNIAPDRDATFYPRYMSRRGLQLGGEFRYLNDNNDGQVNLEYLSSDNEFNDKKRWAFNFEHDAHVFNDWSVAAQVKRVSDEQYFEDLGSSLALSSQRHLESRFKLDKTAENWSFTGLLQDFQTIDRTIASVNRPYERLPHLRFDAWTDTFANGFQARIETEYTDFDRDNSITGKRTDLYPSITYNHETSGYYVRPKLGVHYTRYSLDNEGALPSSPNRTIPIISLDSGLFYERNSSLLGQSMLQTLEPRIYYLRVPEKNQVNIPIFDTGIYDYNSSSLFRENRFSGLDRIGDTNQVSVGITSRFLDPDTGTEKLGLTFGQIYYFSDRDVTLPGGKRDNDSSSPIIAELSYRPYDKLLASALVHWDPETSKTERTIYRLKYQPDDHRILNLAYRYRKDSLKQTDVSTLWPITNDNRWHAVGRWNHSLRHKKTLDILAGVEYESCCWKTRVVARRWLNDINGSHDTGVFFEIELKGLGSIGDDVTSFLETGILGYDRHIKDEDDDTYYY